MLSSKHVFFDTFFAGPKSPETRSSRRKMTIFSPAIVYESGLFQIAQGKRPPRAQKPSFPCIRTTSPPWHKAQWIKGGGVEGWLGWLGLAGLAGLAGEV